MMRRSLMLGALALATSQLALAQQPAPVKIGLVLAKTGVFAETGTASANGAMLAVEMAGNKIAGRPVQVTWLDDASPQGAQQNFTKLVNEDHVVAVLGGSDSASSLAMSAVAKRDKVPLIVTTGAASEITGKQCNRYTFRTQLPIPVAMRALAPVVLEKGKRWYLVSASYALGQDSDVAARAALQRAGGQEVGHDVVPLGTSDFSSYLLKIRQAKPDAVMAGMGGNDFNNLMKQWADYGLRGKVVLASPVISDGAMWAVGPTAATGVFTEQWHYSNPDNSPQEKKFVEAWRSKYGKPPDLTAWQGWLSARMMMAAIEHAKSTDGAAIVQALETVKEHSGNLPVYYRSWDHQLIHPVLVVHGRASVTADQLDMLEILKTVPSSPEELDSVYGSKSEVGCTMGDL